MPAGVHLFLVATTRTRPLAGRVLAAIDGPLSLLELCIRRLRGPRWPLTVVTTDRDEDARVVEIAQRAGVRWVRGPEGDVRAGLVAAAAGLVDDEVVVRASCDNPFPDVRLVELAVQAFSRIGGDWADLTAPQHTGLPHGVGLELFRVAALRSPLRRAGPTADDDKNSPTSVGHEAAARLRRRLDPPRSWAQMRCAVETADDLRAIREVFRGPHCSSDSDWYALCEARSRIRATTPFFLGGAQLGSVNYGRTHEGDPPDDGEVAAMIDALGDRPRVDTAQAYAGSEVRIGRALRRLRVDASLTTKLHPDFGVSDETKLPKALDLALASSERRLGARVEALMLHRHAQLDVTGVLDGLVRLREAGRIDRIGLSVLAPAELADVIDRDLPIDDVQLPYNLVDGRWDALLGALHRSAHVRVIARSTYLQGLLLEEDERRFPKPARLVGRALVDALIGLSRTTGLSRQAIALRFPLTHPDVDGVVVGCQSLVEVQTNRQVIGEGSLEPSTFERARRIGEDAFVGAPDLVDPSTWAIP